MTLSPCGRSASSDPPGGRRGRRGVVSFPGGGGGAGGAGRRGPAALHDLCGHLRGGTGWAGCWAVSPEDARLVAALTMLRDRLAPVVAEIACGELSTEDRWKLARALRTVADALAPLVVIHGHRAPTELEEPGHEFEWSHSSTVNGSFICSSVGRSRPIQRSEMRALRCGMIQRRRASFSAISSSTACARRG